MKLVDWAETDLYDAYKECKENRRPFAQVLKEFAALRYINSDQMFTDVELQYFMQLIRKRDCKENSDEVQEENRAKIVDEYFDRSLYTLQGLTSIIKIEFHYDRNLKKYETTKTIDTVLMLMTRARKLY